MEIPEELGRASSFVARRGRLILALTFLLTVAALLQVVDLRSGTLRIRVDPSLDPLVIEDAAARELRLKYERRFGADETVLVLVHPQSRDIYTTSQLQRIDRLTRGLREIGGVLSVTSLTNTPMPWRTDEGTHLARVKPQEFEDPLFLDRLRDAVGANPLLTGQLVTADGSAAAIVVTLAPRGTAAPDELVLAASIRALADSERDAATDVWVTGATIVRAATSEAVLAQLYWVVPAILVLLGGFLALCFRSLRGVLLPLLVIALALLWTLALLSVTGRPVNLITSLVPPLLATMGLAYCAHVLSEFETLPATADPRLRIAHLVHEMGPPVLLTAFTTGVSLLALCLGDLTAIREFAVLSAVGVAIIALLVLTFLPAALGLRNPPPRPLPGRELFEEGSRRLGRFDLRYRRQILGIAATLLICAMVSALQIRVGDQFVGIFPADSRVRADYDAVNRTLGGVNPMSVVIEGSEPGTFTEPAVLRELVQLEDWLRAQPEVGGVSGLVEHVRLLNTTIGGRRDGALPESPELLRQLLFFGEGEMLRSVVDGDRSSTRISMRLSTDDTAEVGAFLDRLQVRLDAMPENLVAQFTGHAPRAALSVQSVTNDQVRSIALALLLVYACLAMQFTSFTIGLLAAVPTLLQTAIFFGALGITGIPLNATTSLVECLVLGLAVDDTVHYLARFNATAKRTGSEARAAVGALSAVLRPVTLTKAILALGFLMLVTGELQNQVLFGYLAALTLLFAWLVDVFVTPAFMSGVRIVTLWDVLRLDLGRDVTKSIPLFAGLTAGQARIFALMSNLQVVPAGTRLITEGEPPGDGRKGDPGGDIFVVIDGELEVWTERDGARVHLSTIGRGAVVGEAGYFGQKRMASVDALSRARLLRFDDADQERICRRYPAIAARVFLNLNRIQAERRAAARHSPPMRVAAPGAETTTYPAAPTGSTPPAAAADGLPSGHGDLPSGHWG